MQYNKSKYNILHWKWFIWYFHNSLSHFKRYNCASAPYKSDIIIIKTNWLIFGVTGKFLLTMYFPISYYMSHIHCTYIGQVSRIGSIKTQRWISYDMDHSIIYGPNYMYIGGSYIRNYLLKISSELHPTAFRELFSGLIRWVSILKI